MLGWRGQAQWSWADMGHHNPLPEDKKMGQMRSYPLILSDPLPFKYTLDVNTALNKLTVKYPRLSTGIVCGGGEGGVGGS